MILRVTSWMPLRAAFVAVTGGKQVAFLAPTTLLAEQHYQTLVDRFGKWPVKVAELSRFRSPKEVKAALEGIADGTIDISKAYEARIGGVDLGLTTCFAAAVHPSCGGVASFVGTTRDTFGSPQANQRSTSESAQIAQEL